MPRWDPQAEERLRTAAVELFLEHGYEHVTVAQIADRAGLTRRTFSRYFADKRDVLFAGAEDLPPALAEAVSGADPKLPPFEALLAALRQVGAELGGRVAPLALQRRAVIARSHELRERGLSKFAAVADAMTEARRHRGVEASKARLLADVGLAVFQSGFNSWVDDLPDADLPTHIEAAAAELADVFTTRR